MAYRALYRAYRPQTFEDVAGQKHVTITLKNAIKENKIAHAYLFCGPRGTGKTSIAKIFSKAINCENKAGEDPCNTCSNCISITAGEHPDIIELDAASNTSVDDVREIIEKVKYAPISCQYKVYIIDEVHMLSNSAFNALLKTLEEPPAHVIFILATTEPHKLLPTIISRCQRFDFKKITVTDIVDYLTMVLTKEKVTFEVEALRLIAELSDGGMRDSLSILEQCLAYSPKKLTVDDVHVVYGIISVKEKIDFIMKLMKKEMVTVLSRINDFNENGTDLKRLTVDLIDILKDIIIYKNTKRSDLFKALKEDTIQLIHPYITVEECFNYIDIFTNALQKYRDASDEKLYFELACMKISNSVKEEQVNRVPVISVEKAVEEVQKAPEMVVKEPEKVVKEPEKVVKEPIMPIPDNQEPENVTEEVHIEEVKPIVETNKVPSSSESKSVQTNPVIDLQVSQDIEVDLDDILNILVQAKRPLLVAAQEKWGMIKRYMSNLNTARLASMLVDCNPVAACKNGLIIEADYKFNANKINSNENYLQLKGFIKNILGEEYDFICLTGEEWLNIRNNVFIPYKREGKLPSARPITLKHIDLNYVKTEQEELSQAKQDALANYGDIVEFTED